MHLVMGLLASQLFGSGSACSKPLMPSRVVRASVEEGMRAASRHSGQASMHDAEQPLLIQRQQQHTT